MGMVLIAEIIGPGDLRAVICRKVSAVCVIRSQIKLLGRMLCNFSRFKEKPGNWEFKKMRVGWITSRGGVEARNSMFQLSVSGVESGSVLLVLIVCHRLS